MSLVLGDLKWRCWKNEMITNIFFDYGGVLVPSATTSISENPNRDRIKQLFYEPELLIGDEGTLQRLLSDGYRDLNMTPEQVISIFDTRERYWMTWNIAHRLRHGGLGVGMISDCFYELAQSTRNSYGVASLFDPLILSPEVKLTKRNKRIFEHARNLVKANSDQLVMIDDNINCLDNAVLDGWNAIHFRDQLLLETQLKNLGVSF